MPDTGEFKARSVELPNADMRVTVVYKGGKYDNLTDAEFIASLSGKAAE